MNGATGTRSRTSSIRRGLTRGRWSLRGEARGGFKYVILHGQSINDGFCLWPSKYTEHSVKNSPWRGGRGDVVREFVNAMRAEGLRGRGCISRRGTATSTHTATVLSYNKLLHRAINMNGASPITGPIVERSSTARTARGRTERSRCPTLADLHPPHGTQAPAAVGADKVGRRPRHQVDRQVCEKGHRWRSGLVHGGSAARAVRGIRCAAGGRVAARTGKPTGMAWRPGDIGRFDPAGLVSSRGGERESAEHVENLLEPVLCCRLAATRTQPAQCAADAKEGPCSTKTTHGDAMTSGCRVCEKFVADHAAHARVRYTRRTASKLESLRARPRADWDGQRRAAIDHAWPVRIALSHRGVCGRRVGHRVSRGTNDRPARRSTGLAQITSGSLARHRRRRRIGAGAP